MTRTLRALPAAILLLTASCATPMVGLESRRIDLPTSGAEPEVVRELAAEVTRAAAALDLRDLFARALEKAARDGAENGRDVASIRVDRVGLRRGTEPLDFDSMASYSHSTSGPAAFLGLEEDDMMAELGDHELLLEVSVEVTPWPDREGFTSHPELLCARAEVLWVSILEDTAVDLFVAKAMTELATEWIADRLVAAASEQGIDCRAEVPLWAPRDAPAGAAGSDDP